LFVKQLDFLPDSQVYCIYNVKKRKNDILFTKQLFPKTNIVNALVKTSLFKPVKVNGDDKLSSVFKAMYTVYVNGIKYVSNKLALILMMMILAWTLFYLGFTNLFQVLRNPGQIWSLMTSVDFKAKAVQAIVAILFFALPLPARYVTHVDQRKLDRFIKENTVVSSNDTAKLLEVCGIQYDRYREAEERFQSCMLNHQEQFNLAERAVQNANTEEIKNIENLFEFLKKIRNKINSFILSLSNNPQDIEDMLNAVNANIYCSKEKDERDRAYQDLQVCFAENNLNEVKPDMFGGGSEFSLNSGVESEEVVEFKLPLSIALLQGFIDYGSDLASSVAKWADAGITNYMLTSLTQQESFYRKMYADFAKVQEEQESMSVELADSEQCGFSCSNIYDKDFVEEKIKENSHCEYIYLMQRNFCEKEKERQIRIGRIHPPEEFTNFRNTLITQIRTIENSFSWLAPAIIPYMAVLTPFTTRPDLTRDSKAELVTERIDEILPYLNFKSALNSITSTVEGIYHTAKNVYSFAQETKAKIDDFSETDTSLSFILGFSTALTSVPPGSWIFNVVNKISTPMGKILGNVATFVLSTLGLLSGSFWMNLIGTSAALVGKGITSATLAIFSSCIVLVLFQILPFIAVSIATILRFIFYLFEVIRTVFCLPFYAVIVATRKAEGVLEFFRHLIRLLIIPTLLAISPVFAFFAIELVYFLLQKVPLSILFSSIVPHSMIGGFMAGILVGIITIFASFVGTAIAWNIAHGFTDKVIEEVSSLIGSSGTHVEKIVSPARSMFSRLTHTAF